MFKEFHIWAFRAAGQCSLTIATAFVTTEKLSRTATMTANMYLDAATSFNNNNSNLRNLF